MKAVLARVLVRLYSSDWRARYEKEFVEFLAETPISFTIVWDVAASGIRESMTRRLRQRADQFRGLAMAKQHSLAQIGAILVGIAAFSLVAEANPRWTTHRSLENFRIWPGDSRIHYEAGTEFLAAAASAALASTRFTQSEIDSRQPILIYVCASKKNADAFQLAARLDKSRTHPEIFISPPLCDAQRSALIQLTAQWHNLAAAGLSPVDRAH